MSALAGAGELGVAQGKSFWVTCDWNFWIATVRSAFRAGMPPAREQLAVANQTRVKVLFSILSS